MHYHFTIENIIFVGISALIFFNVWRIVAAWLVKQPGPLGSLGIAMGGLIKF